MLAGCSKDSDTEMTSKKMDWPRLCMVCSTYVKGSELRNHMKSHAGKINHQCPYCFDYIKSNDMPHHMKTHTGDKPYYCTQCKFRGKSKSMLKFHKKREHNWEEKTDDVISGDPVVTTEKEEFEEVQIPKSTTEHVVCSTTEHVVCSTAEVEDNFKLESYDSTDNDSQGSSGSTSTYQPVMPSHLCQLCFTSVPLNEITNHKCMNSFNRSDYHFLFRDRHFELSSELAQPDIGELQQNVPVENFLPPPKIEEPLTCAICSMRVYPIDVAQHMAEHGRTVEYVDEVGNRTFKTENPPFKIASFLDLTDTKELPDAKRVKIDQSLTFCNMCASYINQEDMQSHRKLHETRLMSIPNN